MSMRNGILPLAAISMLAVTPCAARDFEYTFEGQTLTYTVIDETEKTCKTREGQAYREPGLPNKEVWKAGNEVEGALVIPARVSDGKAEFEVVEIGSMSFYACKQLTEVTLPPTLRAIADRAFLACVRLADIKIPADPGRWAAFHPARCRSCPGWVSGFQSPTGRFPGTANRKFCERQTTIPRNY